MAAGPRQIGSNVHSLMVDAASRPQVDRKQINVFTNMFKNISDDNIRAFLTLAENYKASDPIETRMSVCVTMMGVINVIRPSGFQREYDKTEVDVSCLTRSEFTALIEVVDIMKQKSQAQRGQVGESAGPVMLADLMTELEIATLAETRLPSKLHKTTPPYYAKMRKVAQTQGVESRLEELLTKAGPEGWEREWETDLEIRPSSAGSANVFNVDHMVLFAVYCKAAQFSLSGTLRFAEKLALFSMMRNVGRDAQKVFWKSNNEFKYIRAFMHESFEGIHDSPFKLTFTRCLRAVTCLMPAASDLAPLYVRDKQVGLKMIASVCMFQRMAGEVKIDPTCTSTSEHLVHQVMLSGMEGTLHLNKNKLIGSALFKVTFTYDREADHQDSYKVVKMNARLCADFKKSSNKIVQTAKNETAIISDEFFAQIMGNSHKPSLVGKTEFESKDKWNLPVFTLTAKDMTAALNSLDEGYTSYTGIFKSFESLKQD